MNTTTVILHSYAGMTLLESDAALQTNASYLITGRAQMDNPDVSRSSSSSFVVTSAGIHEVEHEGCDPATVQNRIIEAGNRASDKCLILNHG